METIKMSEMTANETETGEGEVCSRCDREIAPGELYVCGEAEIVCMECLDEIDDIAEVFELLGFDVDAAAILEALGFRSASDLAERENLGALRRA